MVSAGDLAPIRRDLDGNTEPIEGDDTGLPLGIIPDQTFVQDTFDLKPGDTWVQGDLADTLRRIQAEVAPKRGGSLEMKANGQFALRLGPFSIARLAEQ